MADPHCGERRNSAYLIKSMPLHSSRTVRRWRFWPCGAWEPGTQPCHLHHVKEAAQQKSIMNMHQKQWTRKCLWAPPTVWTHSYRVLGGQTKPSKQFSHSSGTWGKHWHVWWWQCADTNQGSHSPHTPKFHFHQQRMFNNVCSLPWAEGCQAVSLGEEAKEMQHFCAIYPNLPRFESSQVSNPAAAAVRHNAERERPQRWAEQQNAFQSPLAAAWPSSPPSEPLGLPFEEAPTPSASG